MSSLRESDLSVFLCLWREVTSQLREKRLPILTAQAMTGHKSTQMLKRYTHISGKVLVDAVRG